jgi:hypothetical protein
MHNKNMFPLETWNQIFSKGVWTYCDRDRDRDCDRDLDRDRDRDRDLDPDRDRDRYASIKS